MVLTQSIRLPLVNDAGESTALRPVINSRSMLPKEKNILFVCQFTTWSIFKSQIPAHTIDKSPWVRKKKGSK